MILRRRTSRRHRRTSLARHNKFSRRAFKRRTLFSFVHNTLLRAGSPRRKVTSSAAANDCYSGVTE